MTRMSLVDEAKAYERQRENERLCRISSVQPVNCIVLNSVPHSGVVTHSCSEPKKHPGDCKCKCGYQWKGK